MTPAGGRSPGEPSTRLRSNRHELFANYLGVANLFRGDLPFADKNHGFSISTPLDPIVP